MFTYNTFFSQTIYIYIYISIYTHTHTYRRTLLTYTEPLITTLFITFRLNWNNNHEPDLATNKSCRSD